MKFPASRNSGPGRGRPLPGSRRQAAAQYRSQLAFVFPASRASSAVSSLGGATSVTWEAFGLFSTCGALMNFPRPSLASHPPGFLQQLLWALLQLCPERADLKVTLSCWIRGLIRHKSPRGFNKHSFPQLNEWRKEQGKKSETIKETSPPGCPQEDV